MIQSITFLGVLFAVFIVCIVMGACAASANGGNVVILSKVEINPLDDSEC
jgi:hypothetical protein